jgi:hypothetical protein
VAAGYLGILFYIGQKVTGGFEAGQQSRDLAYAFISDGPVLMTEAEVGR